MQTTILDGARMRSRESAHDEIAQALNFPAYYGRNLDALWDLVSTMEVDVTLVSPTAMLDALGSYGEKLLATLQEAAEKNPCFRFHLQA